MNPGTGIGEYFYGDAVAYARFLRVTSAALKRGNPRAKVVFTGVIEPYDAWLAKVLAQPGTVRAFDVANAHFRGGIGKLDDMVRAAKAAFRRGGFQGPLWVSEMGYPSDQFFQWDPRYVGINPPTAQLEQAALPARRDSVRSCAAAPGASSSRCATSTDSGGSSPRRACSTGPSRP